MRGLNSVTLGGNLARDAELYVTNSGTSVLNFTICVNGSRRAEDGSWEDAPYFFDCVMFGNRAQAIARYMGKGTYVALTGEMRQNRWETKDGERRSKVEVAVSEIHFDRRATDRQETEEYVYEEDVPF